MLSLGLPVDNPFMDVQTFIGLCTSNGAGPFSTWRKPKGKTMSYWVLMGGGGNGGVGVIGANSTAAGGGGGGSGSLTTAIVPLLFLPDELFIEAPALGAGVGVNTYVLTYPSGIGVDTWQITLSAKTGSNGNNGSGATAGTGGNGAAALVEQDMPNGWPFVIGSVAGHAGTSGGTTSNGAFQALPVSTSNTLLGGTGGGGLPAAGVAGKNGGDYGSFSNTSLVQVLAAQLGGLGATGATVVPGSGNMGFEATNFGIYYGGTGGGSTHGSASGAGLQQSSGGNGMIGCGGGGSGGALTASAAGVKGLGGPGAVYVVCW